MQAQKRVSTKTVQDRLIWL